TSPAWRTARASTAGGAAAGSAGPTKSQGTVRQKSVIAPQQSGEPALHLHFVGPVDLRIVGAVRGIEPDHAVLAPQVLERRFLVAHERHHYFPVARGVGAAHERVVAVENTRLDHRIARNFERIMLARAEQRG